MLATQPLQPTLGVAREKDGGSLRALCQVCSPSGEIMDSRKACVLVTIYRRESDLFALLLRERHDDLGNLGGGGGGAVSNAPGSVLCDVTVDDAVHLEPQSSPLVVKVVNTRVGGDVRAYVLEFGRAVDLMTFQRGFTAARGYFRQMLTLRTLVSDSFWQGFASGAGGPVRNDPLAPPTLALEPPPGAPGQPYPGLRDKQTGPGAGGVNPEDLAAAVGQWSTEAMLPATTLHPSGWAPSPRARPRVPSTPTPKSSRQRSAAVASSKKNNGIALVGQVAPSPRVDKAAAAASGNAGSIDGKSGLVTFTRSNRANRGNTASVIYLLEWPYPDAGSAAEKAANKSHNLTMVEAETSCHRCHSGKERLREGVVPFRFGCLQKKNHAYCSACVKQVFSVPREEFEEGIKRWVCPICEGYCKCGRCLRPQGSTARVSEEERAERQAAAAAATAAAAAAAAGAGAGAKAKATSTADAKAKAPSTADSKVKASTADTKVKTSSTADTKAKTSSTADTKAKTLSTADTKAKISSATAEASSAAAPTSVGTVSHKAPVAKVTTYEGLFTKYLQSLPTLDRLPLTEDVCFLCKEGGDLVECDEGSRWACRVRDKNASLGNPPPPPGAAYSCCGVPEEMGVDTEGGNRGERGEFERCKKVYHAYCMGFEIGDAELGSCPRHACQECGDWAENFCRFCPVSLCGEHFRSNSFGTVAETFQSVQRRSLNPFPRTNANLEIRAPRGEAELESGRGRGRVKGKVGRPRGKGRDKASNATSPSARSHSGGSPSGRAKGNIPANDSPEGSKKGGSGKAREGPIAGRRPKRGLSTTNAEGEEPEPDAKRPRVEGPGGKPELAPAERAKLGLAVNMKEKEFVCDMCKMAAKRAVRQFGLLGALETVGILLPYGESDESGDESESDIVPVPLDSLAAVRMPPSVARGKAAVSPCATAISPVNDAAFSPSPAPASTPGVPSSSKSVEASGGVVEGAHEISDRRSGPLSGIDSISVSVNGSTCGSGSGSGVSTRDAMAEVDESPTGGDVDYVQVCGPEVTTPDEGPVVIGEGSRSDIVVEPEGEAVGAHGIEVTDSHSNNPCDSAGGVDWSGAIPSSSAVPDAVTVPSAAAIPSGSTIPTSSNLHGTCAVPIASVIPLKSDFPSSRAFGCASTVPDANAALSSGTSTTVPSPCASTDPSTSAAPTTGAIPSASTVPSPSATPFTSAISSASAIPSASAISSISSNDRAGAGPTAVAVPDSLVTSADATSEASSILVSSSSHIPSSGAIPSNNDVSSASTVVLTTGAVPSVATSIPGGEGASSSTSASPSHDTVPSISAAVTTGAAPSASPFPGVSVAPSASSILSSCTSAVGGGTHSAAARPSSGASAAAGAISSRRTVTIAADMAAAAAANNAAAALAAEKYFSMFSPRREPLQATSAAAAPASAATAIPSNTVGNVAAADTVSSASDSAASMVALLTSGAAVSPGLRIDDDAMELVGVEHDVMELYNGGGEQETKEEDGVAEEAVEI